MFFGGAVVDIFSVGFFIVDGIGRIRSFGGSFGRSNGSGRGGGSGGGSGGGRRIRRWGGGVAGVMSLEAKWRLRGMVGVRVEGTRVK